MVIEIKYLICFLTYLTSHLTYELLSLVFTLVPQRESHAKLRNKIVGRTNDLIEIIIYCDCFFFKLSHVTS